MSGKWTKDERFVLCAFEAAMRTGEFDASLDRYEIGKAAGLAKIAVDTICVLLGQANFIKKNGPVEIRLTSNGKALAESLTHQK